MQNSALAVAVGILHFLSPPVSEPGAISAAMDMRCLFISEQRALCGTIA